MFIDPPYNTGNEGWCYNDNVNSPMMQEWLKSNPIGVEDGLRHDKWCAMMWPRLRLIHELMSHDGVIFVCISDHEVHRLKALLDEIFGTAQFAACLTWKSRAKPSNTGEAKVRPQNDAEYILVYEKNEDCASFNLVHSGFDRSYPYEDGDGKYRIQTILKSNRGENERQTMRFPLNGYVPPVGQRWQAGEDTIQSLFDNNRLEFRAGTPFRKYYAHDEPQEHAPFYCYVDREKSQTAEAGKKLLNAILGENHGMDTVKPLDIVRYCLTRVLKPTSIVLDSFAGSGTTAHAVLEANMRDGGNRKFIMVECEDYAERLTAERIRRVISGYDYVGTDKVELYSRSITYSDLRRADQLLNDIAAIENLEGSQYDRLDKKVKDGVLLVEGVKQITERMAGLGGEFTYCTLGAAVDMDRMLTGEHLPSFDQLGALLYHMATNEAIQPGAVAVDEATGVGYLGESAQYHVWLIYKPELGFLQSREAALTLAKAQAFVAAKPGKKQLVFAPAKFVSQRLLGAAGLAVEFAPLPWALYRAERG